MSGLRFGTRLLVTSVNRYLDDDPEVKALVRASAAGPSGRVELVLDMDCDTDLQPGDYIEVDGAAVQEGNPNG